MTDNDFHKLIKWAENNQAYNIASMTKKQITSAK